MERLSELLGHAVQFQYTAWDRIVLNGYLDRLQRPENISYFFREVLGAPAVTPEVLMSRTAPYRAWVTRYAAEHAIPLVAAVKDQRKEELVAPYYRQFKEAAGVVAIVTSTESGRTFVSYTPRYPPSSGDPGYRLLHPARKRFLHYYFYLLDAVLGPMSVRVATSASSSGCSPRSSASWSSTSYRPSRPRWWRSPASGWSLGHPRRHVLVAENAHLLR